MLDRKRKFGQPDRVYTGEIAEDFGVDRSTVLDWCEKGLIPGAQKTLGGTTYVDRLAYTAWAQAQPSFRGPRIAA